MLLANYHIGSLWAFTVLEPWRGTCLSISAVLAHFVAFAGANGMLILSTLHLDRSSKAALCDMGKMAASLLLPAPD
jgi:hypothetical protein